MHFLWLWVGLGCTNGPKEAPPRVVEQVLSEGVTSSTITVGTVVPLSGEMGVIGRAVVEILEARASLGEAFEGRHVSIVAADGAGGHLAAAQRLVEEQDIFALVAPLISGEEPEFAEWAQQEGIPVVGPFAVQPAVTRPPAREVFYVYPGTVQQVRSLVHDAVSLGMPAALVTSERELFHAHRLAMDNQAARYEGDWRVRMHEQERAGCAELATQGVHRVILDGEDAQIRSWFEAAGQEGCTPEVWLMGEALERVYEPGPIDWNGRLFASTASRPSDWTQEGISLYQETLKRAGKDPGPLPIQLGALASYRLFEEGLTRMEEPASREGLVRALEALHGFETGLTRPLSYGPMRRVGAMGSWITEREARLGYAMAAEDSQRWVEAK